MSGPTSFTCAACGQPTPSDPCTCCGDQPLLEGRYRLLRPLGRGAVATTWRAEDTEDGDAPVAIKELPWRPGDAHARALREARVLGELDHPGIPRLRTHFFTQQGRHRALCIVEDLVVGQTLREEAQGRRYSAAEVLSLLEELLDTLVYLHERSPPVVHRDITPANIIRRAETGQPVLVDFSAVQDALVDPDLGAVTATGTFGYMAPEQLQGRAEPRSDLYGLGALAVALLSRTDPQQLLDHSHRLRWEERVSLPPRIVSFLRAMLAADPEDRPPSARAARSMLRAARSMLDGHEAQRVQPPAPAPPPELATLLRQIVREEIQEALARQDHDGDDAPAPAAPAPPAAAAEETALVYPANLGQVEPHQRRGWWQPRPMTELERRRPMHPAAQMSLAIGLFITVAATVQLLLGLLL